MLHRVGEEVLAVQVVIQHLGLGFVDLLHVGQAADVVFQVLEHQAGHVDAPARRGVVHAVLVQQGGVVHHGGHIVGGMAQQVIPHNGNGHAGGGYVLLHAKVDAAVLGHIHRLGEDHGAHVRHQRHAFHLGHLHVLGAENGVVLADVDVAGVLVVVDGVHIRNVGKVFILAGRHNVHLAELGGFLGGQVGEVAGNQVIGLAGGHKVQRHHGKLLGGTALEKADLVVVGNVHHPAQRSFGVLDDGIEPLAAVAHLHHALAAVAVFQQLCLGLPENLLGQHAGACAEVVYSCHNEPLPFLYHAAPLFSAVPFGFDCSRSIPVLQGRKQEHLCTKMGAQKPRCRHETHKCAPEKNKNKDECKNCRKIPVFTRLSASCTFAEKPV